ncbi:unnamed protein product [Allacma fusca]|uniref:DUF4806 domain-containing protein n=1 Tax=Allacma fusca TaxID=39272 RepID=A0A8J2K281_9HEXA|nr:unnamed protein product [Allacma fusca]
MRSNDSRKAITLSNLSKSNVASPSIIPSCSCNADSGENSWTLALPSVSTGEVLVTESSLVQEDIYAELWDRIKNIGGSSYGDCARRILRKLMNDEAVIGFNWKGQQGKHALSSFVLMDIVKKSVQNQFGKKCNENLLR